jgi:hypothetical protein
MGEVGGCGGVAQDVKNGVPPPPLLEEALYVAMSTCSGMEMGRSDEGKN